MIRQQSRNEQRIIRHNRLRTKLAGTKKRPRLCVFKSNLYIYCQVIDDDKGHTLVQANTKELTTKGKNIECATQLGTLIAQKALKAGIKEVVFDRGGYIYHGRVKAVAEAARAAGLKF